MKRQLICLFVGLFGAACGASPDGSAEAISSTFQSLSTGTIAGAYAGNSGAQFADLVLDPTLDDAGQYPYFLEENGGLVSCTVGVGCTVTHEREDGHYSATATHLTVHPSSGPERVYSYVRDGNALTLTREGVTGSFSDIHGYCDTAADCPGEGLIRPECGSPTSGWECNAHACSYACSGAD